MISSSQRDSVVLVLSKILQAIDSYRVELEIEPEMGIEIDVNHGYQPSFDDLLKRWRMDAVGTGLREGIKEIGRMVAPHVTMQEL